MLQKIFITSLFTTLFLSFLLLTPAPTYAQGLAQLAECSGPDCGTCEVIRLANGLIMWLIGFVFLLFALLLMRAGVKLVTSGGNPSALQSAKDSFINALIGLIIILAAWLIVDTLMRALVGDSRSGALVWSEIECTAQVTPDRCTRENGCVEDINLRQEHEIIVGDNGGAGGGGEGGGGGAGRGGIPSPDGCSVPGITPITDPEALRLESGVRVVYNNSTLQRCAQRFTSLTGGSVTSAYRPTAYQTHLWELHDRWCAQNLQSNNDPNCSSLKSAVQAEMSSHGLSCGRPVARANSNHSSGRAIDVSGISHGSASVLGHARNSCLSWPLGMGDPPHYELISGCNCD